MAVQIILVYGHANEFHPGEKQHPPTRITMAITSMEKPLLYLFASSFYLPTLERECVGAGGQRQRETLKWAPRWAQNPMWDLIS